LGISRSFVSRKNEKNKSLENTAYMVVGMKKQGARGRKHQKRLDLERRVEALDNFDIVEIDDRRPRDHWALREMQEEYCKELYGPENCPDE
jgi:hypothetical protein